MKHPHHLRPAIELGTFMARAKAQADRRIDADLPAAKERIWNKFLKAMRRRQ